MTGFTSRSHTVRAHSLAVFPSTSYFLPTARIPNIFSRPFLICRLSHMYCTSCTHTLWRRSPHASYLQPAEALVCLQLLQHGDLMQCTLVSTLWRTAGLGEWRRSDGDGVAHARTHYLPLSLYVCIFYTPPSFHIYILAFSLFYLSFVGACVFVSHVRTHPDS